MADHQRDKCTFVNTQHNHQCDAHGKARHHIRIDHRHLVHDAHKALGRFFGVESADGAQSPQHCGQKSRSKCQQYSAQNHPPQFLVGKQIDIIIHGKTVDRTNIRGGGKAVKSQHQNGQVQQEQHHTDKYSSKQILSLQIFSHSRAPPLFPASSSV